MPPPTSHRVLHYLRTAKAVPIIHRDIKPENILVSKVKKGPNAGSTSLKLADFGWAVAMVPDAYRLTLCGTPEYMPPEVASEDAYSGAFDVWTLGVLLFEMLVGSTPFEDGVPAVGEGDPAERMGAIMDRIVDGSFTVPEHISPQAADLLQGMLTTDQHTRLKPGAIRRHPWMVGHVGMPAEGTFQPSKAGTRLVKEAVRRAEAGAAPASPPQTAAPVEPVTVEPMPAPAPMQAASKAVAKSGPRRVLVQSSTGPNAGASTIGAKGQVASKGASSGVRKTTTTAKRTVTRRRAVAGKAVTGISARRLR